MKNIIAKNKIAIIAIIFIIGCIITVAVYTSKASAISSKINSIMSIMLNERNTDSVIQYQGIVHDDNVVYNGEYILSDDLYEYIFDQDDYIIAASRTKDKTSDIINATSENQDDLETRALNLHLRNLGYWLKGGYSINKISSRMGETTFEIREINNENPTGRTTYVVFSKGGALISLVSVNKPVPEAELTQKGNISEEKAAEIAFLDLSSKFGDVLEDKDFSKVQWTADKAAFNQRLAWKITFATLTRSDFQTPDKRWEVMFWVDTLTGDILERAYSS